MISMIFSDVLTSSSCSEWHHKLITLLLIPVDFYSTVVYKLFYGLEIFIVKTTEFHSLIYSHHDRHMTDWLDLIKISFANFSLFFHHPLSSEVWHMMAILHVRRMVMRRARIVNKFIKMWNAIECSRSVWSENWRNLAWLRVATR